MLLNIPQCTGKFPTKKKIILHKIPIVLKLRNPVLDVGKREEGEGNGTPLQYSCLANPMDGGAW